MKYENGHDHDHDPDIDEDMKLTRNDYITILRHYNTSSRRDRNLTTKTLKTRAHKILGDKFCDCIAPKVRRNGRIIKDTIGEGRRIAYCTRSIFNNRGLKRHSFRCRGRGNTRKLVGNIVKTENVVRI